MRHGDAARSDWRRRLAARLGWVSGALFVLVMAAGADRPPRPGFLLIVGYGALLGAAVWRALPLLLDLWDARGAGPAIVRAAVGGFLAGLALVAVTTVLSTGEPSVAVGPADVTVARGRRRVRDVALGVCPAARSPVCAQS